jgi:oligosaccharide reducing-end xylanase
MKATVFYGRLAVLVCLGGMALCGCSLSAAPKTPTAVRYIPAWIPADRTPEASSPASFQTGRYRNLFQEYLGKSDNEIQGKINAAWDQLFYGSDSTQRVYYPSGEDMAYMMDIGNNDVRTEGMSYGMMIAVQLDHQEEFDRLWKWAKTNMYNAEGSFSGYFAWHCDRDGKRLAANPASDGEEWFVTALFFASARWGDGEGIYNYRAEADGILHTMLHKSEEGIASATDMFDADAKQVVFVPSGRNAKFTDPSYHLPAYYELWARWAKEDNAFWADAAAASREFFRKAANPQTGLMPDYADFDGTPTGGEHEDFRYDAWRTLGNVAVDYAWFGVDPWQVEQTDRVLGFLAYQGVDTYPSLYTLDGKPLSNDHSTGLIANAAVAALATDEMMGQPFVQALWDAGIPTGQWRYYDGLWYLMGLLHAGGQFRIYTPD